MTILFLLSKTKSRFKVIVSRFGGYLIETKECCTQMYIDECVIMSSNKLKHCHNLRINAVKMQRSRHRFVEAAMLPHHLEYRRCSAQLRFIYVARVWLIVGFSSSGSLAYSIKHLMATVALHLIPFFLT